MKNSIAILCAVIFAVLSVLPTTAAAADTLEIVFTYGSEKKLWINDVTETFNEQGLTTASGKKIHVNAIAMGSGESMREILDNKREAHITSPASSAFITLVNDEAGRDLIGETRDLVLSPVVIAMWRPMAEAIGWGERPIGWAELLAVANNPDGWAAYDYPQWGSFKFGHTHPYKSNSGLISLLAEAYAGAGKFENLTLQDVQSPDTRAYVESIEKTIVHYGRSTGFFGRKMFSRGPAYLSAAVLYESMVVESYKQLDEMPFPVVAIYPKEGTFMSNHPAGIVNADWVTDEHREAAGKFLDFLLEPEQQKQALDYGFRPALESVPVTAPIDAEHGVDPEMPQKILKTPEAEVIRAVMDLWKERKRHSNIALLIDTSGSMSGQRLNSAKKAALTFLENLGDPDRVSLITFSNQVSWIEKSVPLKENRNALEKRIKTLFASGKTSLYDAIGQAYQYMLDNPTPDRITAVVVLSDGEDTSSKMKLSTLMEKVEFHPEQKSIRVFPIGYGKEADQKILENIAQTAEARAYEGDVDNIEDIFKDIATFF